MEKNKVDISLLQKYLNGELDARAMYEIERQAQDDPILMDVMLGMEKGNRESDQVNLNELSLRIKNRVKISKAVKLFPWKTWAVAASLISAFLLTGLWFFSTPEKSQFQKNAVVQQKPHAELTHKTKVPDVIPETKPIIPLKNSDHAVNQLVLAKAGEKNKNISGAMSPVVNTQNGLDSSVIASTIPLKDSSSLAAGTLNEVVIVAYAAVAKKSVTAASTQTILGDTLHRAFTDKVAGNLIRKNSGNLAMTVTGVVNDKIDHLPLAGAVVRLKGSRNVEAVTNGKGEFSITLPSKKAVIEVTAMGYNRQQVKAESFVSVSINLEQDQSALSEVVVTGKGSMSRPEKAQPEVGWTAYNQYLKKEGKVQTESTGSIKLAFMIDEDGRPVSIKILKGLNAGLNQKAFKIVADGPKWRRDSANPNKEVRLKIKFYN
ncbi:carboxypeptidase-like regulatory domain-containing protein [Pedobacter sp. UYP1]|uniref:carboxypeptidase-like regulatory domain-containing protein n=1 Tax=Pedobacter sp. UYP1 TaxID=1756396 RepID=UPI0033981F4C